MAKRRSALINKPVIQGPNAGTFILRTMVWNIKPGAAPGTNISTLDLSSTRGFNPLSATDASDLAKSASSGDWDLNSAGTILAFSPAGITILGVISLSIVLHDLNSSSDTELYFIDANVAVGHVDFRISERGTVVNLDWTTILDAGDTVRIVFSFITST